jgi:hypothetical protein
MVGKCRSGDSGILFIIVITSIKHSPNQLNLVVGQRESFAIAKKKVNIV